MTSPNHTSPPSTRPPAINPTAPPPIHLPRYSILVAFNTRLLPFALFTIFLITGTVILIYSVVDKRVIPSSFIAGTYITIAVIILIWCLSRFILFLRDNFGELGVGVDEVETGVRGVDRVYIGGLRGREREKSRGEGEEVVKHGLRNDREVVRQESQAAGEGSELRDFGSHDRDSRIAHSRPVLPSFERLSNAPVHPFKPKPQNQPNDLDSHNPIKPRATSPHQTPISNQRTPVPPPPLQEPPNHRAPTPNSLNPTITTSPDKLPVNHSSLSNPTQPNSHTKESRDVTSQTRLTPHILPLSLQINPGSRNSVNSVNSVSSVSRPREAKVTRPLLQSS
ncbi:uncharacterized protein EAF01_005753 [Botrytis porri]|uniref:uncharacterized protein n=1 Tax=Botrytis porri TaxID=87229 RepID=UPI001901EB32|nr:uncharacterized protein EAF01_005753 [Botrytis porri]KAF7905232.1 hypothetical protein EAF01_005753 [Botrytis porri]